MHSPLSILTKLTLNSYNTFSLSGNLYLCFFIVLFAWWGKWFCFCERLITKRMLTEPQANLTARLLLNRYWRIYAFAGVHTVLVVLLLLSFLLLLAFLLFQEVIGVACITAVAGIQDVACITAVAGIQDVACIPAISGVLVVPDSFLLQVSLLFLASLVLLAFLLLLSNMLLLPALLLLACPLLLTSFLLLASLLILAPQF